MSDQILADRRPSYSRDVQVARDNILDTIEQQLSGEVAIVAVTGQDGVGKTTVLRQFAARHHTRTFALFLSSASRWAYNPDDMVEELCDQIERAFPSSDMKDRAHASAERRFAMLLNSIRRKAKSAGEDFFFILDGLEDIPAENVATRDELLEFMPFGYPGVRCLVSGDTDQFPLNPAARRHLRTFPISFFTTDEARQYLEGLGLTDEQFSEVTKITKNVPGHLASVRRLVESGTMVGEVLATAHRSLPDLFALEWKVITTDEQRLILAVLAYENRPYSADRIAAITGIDSENITQSLSALPFVERDSLGSIRFVSEAFRRFANDRLADRRAAVNQLFIDYLLRDQDGDEALAYLPGFFTSANQLAELVAYLSPERFANLYKRSPSLQLVKAQAQQGVEAARKLKRDADVIRFTLQQATIAELADSDAARAEVCALTALGDIDAALGVAEAESKVNVRFTLLTAIEKTRRDLSIPADPSLLDRIHSLYKEIDPEAFGDKITEVAADLFHSFPDLAIELVSRSTGAIRGENAIDWAFAALAMEAEARGSDPHRKIARDLRERIADPAAKRLSAEAEMLMGGLSASEAITEAKRLESAGNQLYMLRRWMVGNGQRADAVEVLDYALRLALRTTEYAVNAEVYRELATCLPNAATYQSLSHYVSLFDGQRASIEQSGPTEEFVRLQLTLARAHWKFDQTVAHNRYIDVYNTIARIEDLAARTACVARLVSSLSRIDPGRLMDQVDELHSLAEQEMWDGLGLLLSQTADHLDVARGVLDALSRSCPLLARKVAGMLNTEPRRDLAYHHAVLAGSTDASTAADAAALQPVVSLIVDPLIRDDAISEWVTNALRSAKSVEARRNAISLAPICASIEAASDRAKLTAKMIAIVAPLSESDPAVGEILSRLESSVLNAWHRLEADWERVHVGYEIVVIVARFRPELARTLVEELQNLKDAGTLLDPEASIAARLGLQLAVRSYAALAKRELESPNDFARLRQAIDSLGSAEEQALLWSDVILRLHAHGRKQTCEAIGAQQLLPLLSAVKTVGVAEWEELFVKTSAALFVGARPAFDLTIGDLQVTRRDWGLDGVVRFLLTHVPPSDPYESYSGSGYAIDFITAEQIIGLLRLMTQDSLIYSTIVDVIDSATSSQRADQFNRRQREELARTLTELAQAKFPNARFITHDGYRIAALSAINRLRAPSEQAPAQTFVDEARRLPNKADQVFVLGVIAASTRDGKVRRQLLESAETMVKQLPVITERVDRYEFLSNVILSVEPQRSREFLEKAIRLANEGTGRTVEQRRLSLIDAMYRRDPKAAAATVSATTGESAKQRAEARVQINRLKDSLALRKAPKDGPSAENLDWSKASWMQLGALNANRAHPVPPDRTLEFMQYAAAQPLADSYAIFAWAIENTVRRDAGNKEARRYLVPLFEACLRGAELALRSGTRSSATQTTLVFRPQAANSETELLVRDGERGDALEFVKDWLREVKPARLWIVDEYFTPDSLEVVQLAQEARDDIQIAVLTSKEAHSRVAAPYDDSYRAAWARVSSQDPPETTITLVGTQGAGKGPIHDRWWLTEAGGGLRLGTSVTGLGLKWSDVSRFDVESATARLSEVAPFFRQAVREFRDEILKYSTFTL